LFLAFFTVFLRTHAASLYLDDSGETVTVAALLGIGHPPGYPFHTLLSHAWLGLPLAGLPARLNLLASFCGAWSATLLFVWLARRGARSAWVAAAAVAALYALGPVFWHNALGAKGSIYQLNNLISVGLFALLAWDDKLSPARVRAFWLLLGLGFAHHYMSQLPLLPAYAFLLWTLPGEAASRRRRLSAAWLLLPGISVYAYLFLRSAWHPGLDWGAVRSLKDFWFFFFRLQYAAAEGTRSFASSLRQSGYALQLLWREGFYVLLPLSAAAFLWLRKERLSQALALAWLFSLAAVAFYLNLTPERIEIMRPFLFPAYLAQAAMAGLGAVAFFQWSRVPRVLGGLCRAVCLALPLGAVAANYQALDLSQYHYAQDNARNLLRVLPRNALVFAQGDAVIFPLWYEQRVRGLRPDVALVGNAVLPMPWVREDLRQAHPDVRQPRIDGPLGAESVNLIVQALVQLNAGLRPLYTVYNKLEGSVPDWHLVSEGAVYRLVCDGDPGPADPGLIPQARLQASVIRGFTRRPMDARTRRLIVGDFAIHHNALGVSLEEAGKLPEALAWYQWAAQIDPESPEYHFNQGNVLYAMTRINDATQAFQAALTLDPHFKPALYNLAVIDYQSGRRGQAIVEFKVLLALDPQRQDLRDLLKKVGAPGF
jgi:tetratricopeptide (TPR) repeat protein